MFLGPAAVAEAQGLVEDFLKNYHKAVFPDKQILGMPLGLMHVDKFVKREHISNPLMPIYLNPQPVHLKRGKTKNSLDSEGRRAKDTPGKRRVSKCQTSIGQGRCLRS